MTSLIRKTWVRQALCVTRTADPDWFHPGKRTRPRDVAAALALSARSGWRACRMRPSTRDPWDIWGGTTPEQRAAMLRAAA